MRITGLSLALAAGGFMAAATSANAAPVVGSNPAVGSSPVQTVQSFGIYVGPRYGYRDYYYGYGYRPYDSYGFGPGYYSYSPGYYGYYGYRGSRAWRRLDRRAP